MTPCWAPLTIEYHIQLGNTLKDARDALHPLLREVSVLPKLRHDAMKAANSIDLLCSSLDAHLHALLLPSRDPRRLAAHVYYGKVRFCFRSYDPGELDADAFAPWYPGSS
jgi:hypothetical protein